MAAMNVILRSLNDPTRIGCAFPAIREQIWEEDCNLLRLGTSPSTAQGPFLRSLRIAFAEIPDLQGRWNPQECVSEPESLLTAGPFEIAYVASARSRRTPTRSKVLVAITLARNDRFSVYFERKNAPLIADTALLLEVQTSFTTFRITNSLFAAEGDQRILDFAVSVKHYRRTSRSIRLSEAIEDPTSVIGLRLDSSGVVTRSIEFLASVREDFQFWVVGMITTLQVKV